MIKAAWLDICKPEVHLKTLQMCDYMPFTMKPAYELQKEEARRVEGLGGRPHISDAPSAAAAAATATAARLAAEIAAISEYTDVFEGSKDVAARVMAAGNFTKQGGRR